jgi:hypothetical protein
MGAVAIVLAALLAFALAPTAQAAAATDRAAAVRAALGALKAQSGDDALTVFALPRAVAAGTTVTQAGPAATLAAARRVRAPRVSAALSRAGVTAVSTRAVLRTTEPSWLLYADQGPSQAYEHPGRVVVVGARTGQVRVSPTLRWVPLFDGRLPEFFRSPAAYRSKDLRVLDRPWKQKTLPAPAGARSTATAEEAAAAQKRLADAIARDHSCALRVSDTLGDFYDFGSVDRTRAALGRAFNRLARLNPGFVTQRYTARARTTAVDAAQKLIAGGCTDLALYVAGSGTRTGAAGIVIGVRPRSGGVQWHTLTAADIEGLVQANRHVTFKLVFDAPYAGRVAQQLSDEQNVSVLLTAGGADEPSFTYLPQILGGQGVIQNTSNPMGLLEFTNNLIVGMDRFSGSPKEIDHAIAERAAGRSDTLMGWMLARALDLAPSLFTTQVLGTPAQQRLPNVTPPVLNRAPVPATPPLTTREDVAADLTLVATDADLDPVTFSVTAGPAHGTLTGTPPLLRYTPDRDFHGVDGLTFRASDGHGGVAEQRVPITVTSDNDAPTVVGGPAGAPPVYTEQQVGPSAVTVDDGLTITDPDSPTLKSATVAIVAGHVPGDVLATTAPASVSQSYDAQAGVLTLTGHVAATVFENALRAVTFRSTSDDPGTARTIRFSVDDGDGDQLGVPADRPLTVVPVNDAPTLGLPSGTVAATEDTPVTFAASTPRAISVTDPDAGAAGVEVTVAASAGTLAAGSAQPGVVVTGGGTGTLRLAGPVGAVSAALDGLTFTPAPDASGAATLTVTADDHGHTGTGGAKTANGTITLAIAPVNDRPVNAVPGAQSVNENGTLTFGPSNALSTSDADAGGADVRVTLTATHGTLTLGGGTAGLTFTTGDGSADATMTFEGTISAVNAALAGTTYTPDASFTGAASVEIATNDLGHSGGPAETDTDTVAVQVLGVNRAPVNHLPAAQSTDEDTDLVLSAADGNALTITDPDAGTADVEVALTATDGVLHLAQTTGLTVTAGADGTAAVTVRGALTDVDAALDGLRYAPAADFNGAATLTVATDDLGHTGQGGAQTDSDTLAITVAAVNDAPALTAPAAATVAEEGTATFSVANVNPISVADADAGAGTIAVDLAATHGTIALGSTAGVTVTGDGTAAVSLSGTRGAVNAALEGTTFTAAADYAGAATLHVDVSDQGHTGSGGAKTDSRAIAITVTAVNDAPAITAPSAATVNKDGSRTFSGGNGNAITIADVDAGGGDVRVQLAVAHGTLRLASTTGLTFTTGDGTDDAALDFTGTLTDVAAALDGLRYAPDAGYAGADALDVDADDQGHTGSGGAQTDSATVTLNVVDLNTAPVNTVPGAQTIDEDTTLTLAGATKLAVADADVDPAAGTLQVTLDAGHGTFTLDGTAGLSFSAGDGTGDAHLVVQGSPDALNAALDGTVYTPDADFDGSDTLTLETDDLGASGAPGPLTDTDTVAVTITPVNDAPVLTQPDAAALTYTEDTPTEDHADAIAPNLTVADVDDTNISGATVTLATAASGDALVFTNQNGITGSYDAGAGVLTLSGSATRADYQTALRSVRYRTTSEDPDTTTRTVTFRVDDGHAADHLSNQVTRTIDVVAVNDAPVADDETFNSANRAIGNTSLVVDGPGSGTPDPAGAQKTISGDIFAGDTDADSPSSAFTATPLTNAATANGGRVTLEADGDFTYLPPQGCATSSDSFDYTLNDNDAGAPQTDTGTVTISIADCVWYVDAGAGAQPTATGGTSQNPYNSLADLDGAGGAGDEDGANDKVFLYAGSYAGPFPLESGQQVLTRRHGLTVSDGGAGTVTLEAPAAGASTITNGVTVSTNNTLEGVDFGASATTALSGTSVGTLTVNKATSGGIVNPGGGGVDIGGVGNALDVHLTTLTAGGSTGVTLANASGTFAAAGGAIVNPTGPAVSLSGGNADFTLGGTVSDNGGTFVSVTTQTGGTKDFNGKLTSTGGGVALSSNSGATLRFDGGLALTTATANAFSATGGGTVAVTDPASDSNVLSTTTGTPLTVANTAIHSDDLTFESISSNGAADGVVLNTTGSAGGLNVTGNGGTCTAGTPTCTGGTIQASTGPGVRADSVGGGVALTRVRVLNGTDDGIRFANSAGLSVASSLVTGNGDNADASAVPAGGRDRGVDVENGTGSVAVTSSQVSASYYDNIRFDNDSGSVDFDLTSTTIAGAKNGDGVQFYGDGTAAMKADVTGSTFSTNFDDGFQLVTAGGAVTPAMDLNFTTNQVTADASQVALGALVTVSPGASATTKVAMSGNTLNTSKGSNLILNPAGSSQFDATVTNNTLTNAGGIAIWGKPAQQGQSRMRIANNTLTNYQGQGMYLRHGEGIGGRADYVVQGNTLNSAVGQEGILVEAGTTSSGSESETVCADIGGAGALANDLANAAGAGFDDVVFARYANSQLILPGYGGGSDPTAFVQSRNTGSPVVSNWGPQDPTGGAACQNPALPPAP